MDVHSQCFPLLWSSMTFTVTSLFFGGRGEGGTVNSYDVCVSKLIQMLTSLWAHCKWFAWSVLFTFVELCDSYRYQPFWKLMEGGVVCNVSVHVYVRVSFSVCPKVCVCGWDKVLLQSQFHAHCSSGSAVYWLTVCLDVQPVTWWLRWLRTTSPVPTTSAGWLSSDTTGKTTSLCAWSQQTLDMGMNTWATHHVLSSHLSLTGATGMKQKICWVTFDVYVVAPLPADTPCLVSTRGHVWCLRYCSATFQCSMSHQYTWSCMMLMLLLIHLQIFYVSSVHLVRFDV